MENISHPEFQKFYDHGYTFGMNPIFEECEDLSRIAPKYRNEAFLRGFTVGRNEYEKLNGSVCDGIPNQILTERILLGFRIDAQLGIKLEAEGYNDFQMKLIVSHYEAGAGRYNESQNFSLYSLLGENGIGLESTQQ